MSVSTGAAQPYWRAQLRDTLLQVPLQLSTYRPVSGLKGVRIAIFVKHFTVARTTETFSADTRRTVGDSEINSRKVPGLAAERN